MLAALRKLLSDNSESVIDKVSHLRNIASGDGFLSFDIHFFTPIQARSMMQEMLCMNHDMNVHLHLRMIDETKLSVHIEHTTNAKTVVIYGLVDDILAMERKVKNGKDY